LGLRHNFKGSLVRGTTAAKPSTSVMDYLTQQRLGAMNTPGDYDAAAIKLPVRPDGVGRRRRRSARTTSGRGPELRSVRPQRRSAQQVPRQILRPYLDYFYKTQNVFVLLYWDYWLNNVLNYVRIGSGPRSR